MVVVAKMRSRREEEKWVEAAANEWVEEMVEPPAANGLNTLMGFFLQNDVFLPNQME